MTENQIFDDSLYKYDEFQGSNALILPSSKEERKKLHNIRNPSKNYDIKTSNNNKMSKRKRRKLRQLEEKKRISEFQETIANDLKKYSLKKEHLELMIGVSNNKITEKYKKLLRKKFKEANIEIPDFLKLKDSVNRKLIRKNEELNQFHDDNDHKTIMNLKNNSDYETKLNSILEINFNNDNNNNHVISEDFKDNNHLKSEDLQEINTSNNTNNKYIRKVTSLKVNEMDNKPKIIRKPEIELQRSELPVRMYEYEILDSIENNDVVIITGATGSGKSTQLPQLLYETGYCSLKLNSSLNNNKKFLIGLTQPRRIAATSLSKRIGEELNNDKIIGYQVRYDKNNCNQNTLIKVMTDGILLQEIQKDLLCSKYSVIIIDEAHERTVNTDILIGILSRVVIFRRIEYSKKIKNNSEDILPPLKLIIMSATLRVTDFSENTKLFSNPPPIVNIETPNYPVTIHFSKNTPDDYILAAYKKIQLIHKKLPPGSILVFVTGKREVNLLVNMINNKKKKIKNDELNNRIKSYKSNYLLDFNNEEEEIDNFQEEDIIDELIDDEDNNNDDINEDISEDDINDDDTDEEDIYENDEFQHFNEEIIQKKDDINQKEEKKIDIWENFNERDNRKRKIRLHKDVDSSIWKGGGVISENNKDQLNDNINNNQKVILKAIPLYASMSYDEQTKAFELPESKYIRNVIISTNVSEASITIPNVRYVIDTGKEKRRQYSNNSDSSHFIIDWISKASANQRTGRAGRVGPGHCYRLYSSSLYENVFKKFSNIDILSIPLDSILLYMHSLGIPNIFEFPFPTQPEDKQIQKSYELLKILDCVQIKNNNYILSNKGISLSNFPLPPRFGKILLLTTAYIRKNMSDYNFSIQLLQQICIVVSFLTIGNLRDNINMNSNSIKNFQSYNIPTNIGNDIELNLWFCINFLKLYNSSDKNEKSNCNYFCKTFDLNFKGMTEIKFMSLQLFQIVKKRYLQEFIEIHNSQEINSISWPPSLPNLTQKQIIRTFFISSFIDHIAVKNDDYLNTKTLYLTSNNENRFDKISIHPNSVLKNSRPKYLIYTQIISNHDNTRSHLCDCILITPDDIIKATSLKHTLIDSSKILSYPTPYYNLEEDCVFAYCIPKYKNNSIIIDLPSSEIKLDPNSDISCEIFLKSILNGNVFKQFSNQKIKKNIKSKNSSKSFKYIINYLQKNNTCTKADLLIMFKKKRDFLLKQILNLYEVAVHNDIRSFWPPI